MAGVLKIKFDSDLLMNRELLEKSKKRIFVQIVFKNTVA